MSRVPTYDPHLSDSPFSPSLDSFLLSLSSKYDEICRTYKTQLCILAGVWVCWTAPLNFLYAEEFGVDGGKGEGETKKAKAGSIGHVEDGLGFLARFTQMGRENAASRVIFDLILRKLDWGQIINAIFMIGFATALRNMNIEVRNWSQHFLTHYVVLEHRMSWADATSP